MPYLAFVKKALMALCVNIKKLIYRDRRLYLTKSIGIFALVQRVYTAHTRTKILLPNLSCR